MANITSLGGALPLLNNTLSSLSSVEREINRFGGDGAAQKLAQQQLSEQNRMEEQVAATKTAREQAIIDAQSADEKRRRDTALKQAVARQRAAFGAAGIEDGGDNGSGEAVLLGLTNEAQQEQASEDSVYDLRRKILDDNLDSIKQRNLLEESQLAARNNNKRGWFSW